MCVCPVIKSTRNRAVIVWLSSVDLVSGPVPSYDDTVKRSIEINGRPSRLFFSFFFFLFVEFVEEKRIINLKKKKGGGEIVGEKVLGRFHYKRAFRLGM